METVKKGVMECWSVGVLGYSDPMMFLKALLHHSSTPALHGS
jgi:hypothetical protein